VSSQAEETPTNSAEEPIALFREWYAEAKSSEPNDPDAMALASVDAQGRPDVRMVLLKDYDLDGFVFYTNFESAKGLQLAGNPQAAICFHWKSLRRQVRIRGPVVPVSAVEADAYFGTRPKDSQIGAWASRQSRELESRFALEKEIARYAAKFAFSTVPRPDYWSGYRIRPLSIEFWRDRPFRLHDRTVYRREDFSRPWTVVHLYP
jgi:pyridoxamine 5'-phosphate oxidase